MALFGRDYDYDHGFRAGRYGARGNRNDGGWFGSRRGGTMGYGAEYGYQGNRGGMWGSRYDTGMYGSNRYGSDYGREYKSRWQIDHGDPFGDREQQTPMRMIREDDRDYDRGYRGSTRYDRNWAESRGRYERDYYGNPMGYEPYGSGGRESGYRGRARGSSWFGRDYDRGWF